MRLVLTALAAMLGAGMGMAFYGLGALDGTARSGVGPPPLQPAPLPTAASEPTPTPGLLVVLVATNTPTPLPTPNLTPPPTPFVRPTPTPLYCGPHVKPGRLCTMPEPAPTNDTLPEQP